MAAVQAVAPGPGLSGDEAPHWTPQRIRALVICIAAILTDGIDVMVVSYAAVAIGAEWALSATELGFLFSIGVFGMTLGAFLIASLADRIGRKPAILIALTISMGATSASAFASSFGWLCVIRFICGLGVGGMIPISSAMAAEFAPPHRQSMSVALSQVGYPLGGLIAGIATAALIGDIGWRGCFMVAAVPSAILIPIVIWGLSESPGFLIERRPPDALARLNAIRARDGLPPLDTLPPATAAATDSGDGPRAYFAGTQLPKVLALWLSIFLTFGVLYFVLSWIPKLLTMAGLPPQQSIMATALYNIGAIAGTLLVPWVAGRYPLHRTIGAFIVLGALLLCLYGVPGLSLIERILVGILLGCFLQGGFNGFYALVIKVHPLELRGRGLGYATGFGRLGSIAGPLAAGLLLDQGLALMAIFLLFAGLLLVAAAMTLPIGSGSLARGRPGEGPDTKP